ncbi:MAG: glycoside hydrolase family 2 TIM barrel-domain containing protein, partial [Planctomycetota bacterium]
MKFICELSGIGGILGIPLHKRSHCISALCSRHGAGILGGFTVNNVHLFKLILVAFLVCFPYERLKAQSVVQLRKTGETWELTRDGEPYFIRGVGGTGSLSFLKQLGGNSIRTWSVEDAERTLDAAYAEGVTVCVGMWLEHERHGFDYQDQARVQQQKRRCLDSVKRLKDHPAVLMWGIGNEMEGNGKDPAIWKAVEEIAEEIKSLDPNHPTMTVIAELGEGENKIRAIEEHCPSIDVIGVNSYGGITTLASRFKNAKVSKPFVITEHGPAGPWEVGKTSWDSPIEASSTEKAKLYASGYEASVASQAGLCLGAYSFLWGHKQETTATWFGMLLPDGSRLAAVDVISSAWTGKPPANRCPEI